MSNDTSINSSEKNPQSRADPGLPPSPKSKTRISTAWFMAVGFVLGLVLLLIFILQNLGDISIQFLGFQWKIPLGIAMLLAAVVGGLLLAMVGTARIVQLGRRLRRNKS